MKRLNKVLVPFVSFVLAFAMIFAVACGNGNQPAKKTYTVTYTVNGEIYNEQTYEEGQALAAPEEPVVAGFNFIGWNTREDGTGDALVEGSAVTANAVYYAILQSTSSDNPDDGDGDGNTPTTVYTVTFIVDGEVVQKIEVNSGETVTPPTAPPMSNMMFVGWYESIAASSAFDFSTPITSNLTLTAKYAVLDEGITAVGTYNESLYVKWEETTPASAKVEYVTAGGDNWATVDEHLIRATSTTEARVDILGLAAGGYKVKITTSSGNSIQLSTAIQVAAYDRSGYAHFNYTDGVGAYKDNGELKDGTLVIYVTEKNKNNVLDDIYVYHVETRTYAKETLADENLIPQSEAPGVTTGVKITGIGEILNNRRYAGSDRMKVGIAGLCQKYGSVAIRIVGKVNAEDGDTMSSLINGLTAYDSTENGGSVGDNGRMARMTNAKNLTIEGVGEDASIYGWGLHFIASDVLGNYPGAGKSFEVRNITFANYPEDAIGMEGIQGDKWDENGSITGGASSATADLPSPVERCWIHNNTFFSGRAAKPAESDKAEGDGSCDFKRGKYYTLSYNYFENGHKTNLIGSSDSSLQFYVSMHHNMWYNCWSRIPLVRHANVHFYNNYVVADMTANPQPKLNHVNSVRASAYLFSEANYYDGTKNTVDLASGGAVKSYGDVIYANNDKDGYLGTVVSNRTDKISNSCVWDNKKTGVYTDFTSFDTNPALFYCADGESDCFLQTAIEARKTCMQLAGANGRGTDNTDMNIYTPDTAVQIAEGGTTITMPTDKKTTELTLDNVHFIISGIPSTGHIKIRGQGVFFRLSAEADFSVTSHTSGINAPELVDSNGYVWAHKFEGTISVSLPAGVYFIAAGQKEKEAELSDLKFSEGGAASQERLTALKAMIDELPSSITINSQNTVYAAYNAYKSLKQSEQETFKTDYPTSYSKLISAYDTVNALLVDNVVSLINAIGTVSKNSYPAISAARSAYNTLHSELKQSFPQTSYETLIAAESAFSQFAVLNVIDMIDAFVAKVTNANASTERAAVEALIAESEMIEAAYNALSNDSDDGASQQSQVTNYNNYIAALAKLKGLNNVFGFIDALEYFKDNHTVTYDDAEQVNALVEAYNLLTEEQINSLNGTDKALYEKVLAEFNGVKPHVIYCYFTRTGGNSGTPVINTTAEGQSIFSFIASCNGGNDGGTVTTTDGQTVTVTNGLKMESKTEFGINLGSTGTATVKFYMAGSNGVTVNGTAYTAANKVVTVTGLSGNLTVTRNGSDTLIYVEVIYD